MIVWQTAAVFILAIGSHAAAADSGGDGMTAVLKRLDGVQAQWDPGQCIRVEFVEQRQFPFRRYPRKLTGVLWFEAGGNRLAFEYLQPSRMRIIAANDKVYIARGSDAPRRTEEADGDLRIFSQLLGDNPMALGAEWELTAQATDGDDQSYTIKPLPDGPPHGYRSIELRFTASELQSITVRRDNSVVHHYTFEPPQAADCNKAAPHLNP